MPKSNLETSVKAVVDVGRGVMAIAGDLHADEEAVRLQDGARPADLWGINLYPDRPAAEFIEFDSMINVRPSQGNRSREGNLAAGRWTQLSLIEQLANVGSEVGRMLRWRGRDERLMAGAFERALELLDLILADPRWRDRLREVARARELLCDAAEGGRAYGTTLEGLDRYFLAFAVAARNRRWADSRPGGSP